MATQVTTIPEDHSETAGRTSSAALKKLFAGSPIHSGELTPEKLREMALERLLNGSVHNNSDFDGSVSRDYAEAPSLADVQTGGGGLPASPYVPNPTSPGDGSLNPADQAAAPEGYGQNVMSEPWGGHGAGIKELDPAKSSAEISARGLPASKS